MKMNSFTYLFIFKLPIALIAFLCLPETLMAIDKEVVSKLSNVQLTIDVPLEYHISNSDSAIDNSTISLNHIDAWLFFDNIRPGIVNNNYVQFVKINGEDFVPGVNGRLAIYAHGTVLMPHGSSFKPLTIYSNVNRTGDSLKLDLNKLHNKLDNFDNAIKSFKLKRGYMATFATSSDGKGYSRVYTADTEDLEINELPIELSQTVSFIRIFNHQWVTKKGWCGWNADEIALSGSTWYYDWNSGGTSSSNIEYVPIKQNAGWPSWSSINTKQNVSQLLGYNEPDHKEQSDVTVDAAVANWPDFMSSGLRLGAPATTNFGWLYEFMEKCETLNYRVDFVAVHAYWGGKSPINWYNDLKYIHQRTGRPLWITEWNNGANWTNEWWPDDPSNLSDANAAKQLHDLKAILNVLDTAQFIERYSIYNWVEDARAMILNGKLTPAGEFYAQNKSSIAFNKINEVVPSKWNYTPPVLTNRFLSLAKTIKLSWTNDDNDMVVGYRLEKKVNNKEFEIIFETNDNTIRTFNDDLDSTSNGTISYRLSLLTVYGDYIESNVSNSFQLTDNNDIRIAQFTLSAKGWNTCLFSSKYEEKPLVLMGIPTFNNVIGLSQRVNSIQTSSFKFQTIPWHYQKDNELIDAENISIATLPEGVYNFSGLQAEANKIEDVSSDWIPVTFTQNFTTIPVVFCTQLSNSTSIPTTPAIRNVSETGFEISIKCEEAISSAIIKKEKMAYLAVEKGKGSINQKRISVGATGESEIGISSSPVRVEFDDRFSEPALFATMQTSSDAFASTLRYYESNDYEFTIIKQREMSGSPSSVEEDVLGWMIIDLAEGQNTKIKSFSPTHNFLFYPNPTSTILNFNFNTEKIVEIYSESGLKVFEEKTKSKLDVGTLKAGNYILKVDNATSKLRIH